MTVAPNHPHNAARGVFIPIDGAIHPAPAPRFGGTPAPKPHMPKGVNAKTLLRHWGLGADEIDQLAASGAFEA